MVSTTEITHQTTLKPPEHQRIALHWDRLFNILFWESRRRRTENSDRSKKIDPEKIDDNSPLIRVVHKGKGPEVSAADKNMIYVYVSRLLKDAGTSGLAKPHSFRKDRSKHES